MLYLNIQQLHQRKFKVSQIAQELKVSRPTVYKYLKMTFEETKAYMEQLQGKGKKLDPYRDWIIAWLEEYPHLSAKTNPRLALRALFRFSCWREYSKSLCERDAGDLSD